MKPTQYKVPNVELAESNWMFRLACELAKVPPTKRQASKWRNRRGLAYAQRNAAVAKVNNNAKD